MPQPSESTPEIGRRARRGDPSAIAAFDVICRLQMKANLAEIRRMGQDERRRSRRRWLIGLWPVAMGLILGCFAPQLRDLVAPFQPWGSWLLFPFAVIAARPELHLTGELARILPLAALYAQFPIEGLLARMILRRHVTAPGVAREIFFFHFLGAAQLCLVSGALAQLLVR